MAICVDSRSVPFVYSFITEEEAISISVYVKFVICMKLLYHVINRNLNSSVIFILEIISLVTDSKRSMSTDNRLSRLRSTDYLC